MLIGPIFEHPYHSSRTFKQKKGTQRLILPVYESECDIQLRILRHFPILPNQQLR
jgi:hypothetical protein